MPRRVHACPGALTLPPKQSGDAPRSVPVMANIGPVELLIIVLFVVGFGWATGAVARSKGYSFWMFAVLGVIFAPIPLIVAAVLPRRQAIAA